MVSIFGPVWTNVGQNIIKVNVEALMLKLFMFNHETTGKNVSFY